MNPVLCLVAQNILVEQMNVVGTYLVKTVVRFFSLTLEKADSLCLPQLPYLEVLIHFIWKSNFLSRVLIDEYLSELI